MEDPKTSQFGSKLWVNFRGVVELMLSLVGMVVFSKLTFDYHFFWAGVALWLTALVFEEFSKAR